MKCFTIQSGDEYIGDCSRAITHSYYDGLAFNTVYSVDEAKHYKTKAAPKAWIKRTIKDMTPKRDQYDKNVKNGSGYFLRRNKQSLIVANKIVEFVNAATVVELDLDEPNFPDKPYKLRWRSEDHKSHLSCNTVTHGRYACKACGLILKNIPYYELYTGNANKICIVCLKMRTEAIDAAYQALPEDFREAVETEILVSSI
jgi:hypothetical protein